MLQHNACSFWQRGAFSKASGFILPISLPAHRLGNASTRPCCYFSSMASARSGMFMIFQRYSSALNSDYSQSSLT